MVFNNVEYMLGLRRWIPTYFIRLFSYPGFAYDLRPTTHDPRPATHDGHDMTRR